MKMLLRAGLIIGTLLFLGLSVYYWVTPANMLLSFMPGHDAALTTPHVKHALAAALLAVACVVGLWFTIGKKSSGSGDSPAPSAPAEQ